MTRTSSRVNKFKYFSKKHKNYEMANHKSPNPDKTVEVYLFESNTEGKAKPEQPVVNRTPLNKSVEAMCKGKSVSKSSPKPKICLPVYQKYISQVKKVSTSSKLKELHKSMHSSIMKSFVSAKNDFSTLNCKTDYRSKPTNTNLGNMKASSSFIFQNSKSPLSTSKNTTSQNFILKNKQNVKNCATSEEGRKRLKSKRYKRTLSKNSIGSFSKNPS